VYQVVPTPASSATSSRRRPTARRRKPGGRPNVVRRQPLASAAQEGGERAATVLAGDKANVHDDVHSSTSTRMAPVLFAETAPRQIRAG